MSLTQGELEQIIPDAAEEGISAGRPSMAAERQPPQRRGCHRDLADLAPLHKTTQRQRTGGEAHVAAAAMQCLHPAPVCRRQMQSRATVCRLLSLSSQQAGIREGE